MKKNTQIQFLLLLILALMYNTSYSQEFSSNHLLVLKSYLQGNQPEKSINYFHSLNKVELTVSEFIATGNAYYQIKDFKEAANLFLRANEMNSNYGNLELAHCYAMLNKPVFSVKYLTIYLEQRNRLTISEIKTDEAFFNIYSSKEWNEIWEKEWFSNNDLLFNDALYEYRIGNLEESEQKAEQLIKKRPSYHKAHMLLCRIYKEKGKIGDALVYVDNAIELKPKNQFYIFYKSELLLDLDKGKKALKEINQAIALDSSEINFFLQRIKVYLQINENENARQELEGVLAYNNSMVVYRIAGDTYYQNEDYLQSLKFYNKCIKMESLNPDLHISRGLVYSKTGANEFAEKDYSMALDFYPRKGEVYFYRALVRIDMKKYEQACSDLNKARTFGYLNADDYLKRYCQ